MDKRENSVWETPSVQGADSPTETPSVQGADSPAETPSVWGANSPTARSAQGAAGAWDVQANGPASGIRNQPGGMPGPAVVPETEETKRLKAHFFPIAPWAFAYAVFYAFCMYRNGSGVTFPFFVAGSLLFFCSCFLKLGITLKKGSCFYMIAMILLGISTFCTDDGVLIFFNKLGVFLLLLSLLLKQVYDTSKWRLGKYLGSICLLVFAGIGELGRPFSDGSAYYKGRERKLDRRVWYFGAGLAIGIPLLLVVLFLLASADAVFRQMADELFRNIHLGGIVNIVFRITILFFAAYALTAYLCKRKIREEVPDTRRGEPVLAITVTGLLTLLYLLFSGVQIAGLFLGQLRLPQGYTYAMYAREGFFQLLAVSLLNLVIVLLCMSFFRESKILKAILTIMSLCTFVMIASSAVRMIIYIRYYYLTYLRILVLWALALLTLLFAGVVVQIFREDFPLFRYHVAVVAVLYLALSFAHPDYIIARVNLANASVSEDSDQKKVTQASDAESRSDIWGGGAQGGGFFLAAEPYQDYYYLRGLSADAAPVLVPYLEKLGYRMEAFAAEDAVEYAVEHELWEEGGYSGQIGFGYYWMRRLQRNTENFGLRTYNVSRHEALLFFLF